MWMSMGMRMGMRSTLALMLASLALGMAGAAAATPEYRVTVVGPANSRAWDINGSGVVVGNYPYGERCLMQAHA